VLAEIVVDRVRALGLPLLAQEREDGRLVGCELGMEAEDRPRLALDLLLAVGVDQEGEQRAIRARRGLDDVG